MMIIGFCSIVTGACAEEPAVISNGLVEIRIDAGRGRFDVIDLKRGLPIISDSQVGFSVAPYVELADVAQDEFETEQISREFHSAGCVNTVNRQVALECSFPKGNSISIISRKAGQVQLQVQFTLYPQKTFVEISFGFENLNKQPVRLRQVKVIDCDRFMAGCDRSSLQLLNGDSGARKTIVVKARDMVAENNILCFFSDQKMPRSLVAGGLTYADFRKYAKVNQEALSVYAQDPVGKRVDPGQTYKSADRFYLDGVTDNPFEALEAYAETTEEARGIDLNYYTFPSTCMWFLSVTHFGADAGATNSSAGAVAEMQHIVESQFLKYSPVAVRLVPDCYEQNSEQGWWDDKHWQMHGRKERCVVERHYEKPYETTKKWATQVQKMGGIPLTYFQPGIRSEDYASAFPGHMLYNQSNKYIKKNGKIVADPHWVMGDRGIPDILNPGKWHAGYGKLFQENYDYTDPDFLKHWTEVNQNLKDGGVQGVFYDYPDRAFAARGGFEDRYATATHAYRSVFRVARQQQGKNAYLQERIGPGSDATLDFVSSVRTAGDNNTINPRQINQAAMRWYKNRRLTSYDMDGKALLKSGHGKNIHNIEAAERCAILTLSYAVSGRLLLTESFRLFSDEVLHDLSRIYPFHATPLSARPLDAFIRSQPTVFDFPISASWHQLVLYNDSKSDREFEIPISGDTASGAMGLDAERQYYIYDFWNDRFVGKVFGNASIKQLVSDGEARMLSVHAVENRPQWISTDRHIMQGYVDLVKKPEWNTDNNTLSGTSSLIGGELYRITLALNGYTPERVILKGGAGEIKIRSDNKNLADLILKVKESQKLSWKMVYAKKAHYDPVIKNIEGWTVSVDPKLLEGEHAEAGGKALKMLANHLQRIVILMPEKQLENMRKVGIWVEYKHELKGKAYHPDVGWLTARGYDARLAKKVHVARAASLVDRHQMIKQPAVILHELAHAYHHQILGFDESRIKAAYDKAMKAGLYDNVLLYTGKKVRAYAATNHKEYFAEGTEAYFYHNDFYPFVRAELKQHDPVLHDLLEDIWGPME